MTASTESSIKDRLQEDVKVAMRARDKERLIVLRMVSAAIKQIEVDERVTLDDSGVLAVLDKMSKQRKDSLKQYRDAGRTDLADQEAYELDILAEFLPAQLSDDELAAIIDAVFAEVAPESMRDMGKVMGKLKPQLQGRADLGAVSQLVKARFS